MNEYEVNSETRVDTKVRIIATDDYGVRKKYGVTIKNLGKALTPLEVGMVACMIEGDPEYLLQEFSLYAERELDTVLKGVVRE